MELGNYALNDPRYLRDERPKEIWRQLAQKAREVGFHQGSWCDVGCASGALIRYLDSEFSLGECVGVDPGGALLDREPACTERPGGTARPSIRSRSDQSKAD